MKAWKHFFCLGLLVPLFMSVSIGQADSMSSPKLILEEGFETWETDSVLSVFKDTTQHLLLDDILTLLDSFQPYDSFTYPFDLQHDLWASLIVKNAKKDSFSLMWNVGPTNFLTAHLIREGKEVEVLQNGNMLNVNKRTVKLGRGYTFEVKLAPQEEVHLLVKIHEHPSTNTGPKLQSEVGSSEKLIAYFYHYRYSDGVLMSGFLSILAIIFLYNLIIFFSTRESLYLHYALYLLTIGLTLYFENVPRNFPTMGFAEPKWNGLLSVFNFALTTVFYVQFGRKFINSPTLTPKWDIGLRVIMGIRIFLASMVILPLLFDMGVDNIFDILMWLMGIETLFMVIYFIPLIKSGSTIARFFIAGSTMLFVVGSGSLIIQNTIAGINLFVYFLIGIILEILIFSLGLGYRFRKFQKDKLEAEKALNRELSKVNSAFGRFVPHEFLQSLGHETVAEVQLGDQVEKEVTVFFSDIRGYATLSESMAPRDNFRFLNAYLGRVGPIIKEAGGFVNQYFGDGIMALFMNNPQEAIQASVDMQKSLRIYNQERKRKGRVPIKIGIGLHTGPLMMGIIGDQLRMDATVVADTVNTASRMEGLTKFYGADLIISELVKAGLPDSHPFSLRYLGKVLVKGRNQPLGIYECLDACAGPIQEKKILSQEAFEKGIQAYIQGDFPTCIDAFSQVLDIYPDDVAASYFLDKAVNYLSNGVSKEWTGVETMLYK